MNLWLGLLIGLKEIWAHKFRSFLTMLGVILGVASLLSMFALTAGMAKGMREYMQQVGGIERVGIIPQEIPPKQEGYAELSPGRTVADAEAISHSSPLVSYVTPVSQLPAAVQRAGNIIRGEVNGITVIVNLEFIEDLVRKPVEIGPARWLLERNVVGNDGHRVGHVRAHEHVEVGRVRGGILGDEGCFAVAGSKPVGAHTQHRQSRDDTKKAGCTLHGISPAH